MQHGLIIKSSRPVSATASSQFSGPLSGTVTPIPLEDLGYLEETVNLDDIHADLASHAKLTQGTFEHLDAHHISQDQLVELKDSFMTTAEDYKMKVAVLPQAQLIEVEQDTEQQRQNLLRYEELEHGIRYRHISETEKNRSREEVARAKRNVKRLDQHQVLTKQAHRVRTRQLTARFKVASKGLVKALVARKREVNQSYGALAAGPSLTRSNRKWNSLPQPAILRLVAIRCPRSRLPPGQYCIAVSKPVRVGGKILPWDRSGDKCAVTPSFRYSGRVTECEIVVNEELRMICPQGEVVTACLMFELVRIGGASSITQTVAWGVFPLLDIAGQMNTGRYRVPLLRGPPDLSVDSHGAFFGVFADNLDEWFSNFYFEITPVEKSKHSCFGETREYSKRVELSTKLLDHVGAALPPPLAVPPPPPPPTLSHMYLNSFESQPRQPRDAMRRRRKGKEGRVVRSILLHDSGLTAPATGLFWGSLLVLLVSFVLTRGAHFYGQLGVCTLLKMHPSLVRFNAVTWSLEYEARTHGPFANATLFIAGLISPALLAGLLALLARVLDRAGHAGRKGVSPVPAVGWRIILALSIWAVLDPVITGCIDIGKGNTMPHGDMWRLPYFYQELVGSPVWGWALTVALMIAFVVTGWNLLRAYCLIWHQRGLAWDTLRRLGRGGWLCPHDEEVSGRELHGAVVRAKRWRAADGSRRRVVIRQTGEGCDRYVRIDTVRPSGLVETYRHFLRDSEGTITELFEETFGV